MPTEQAKPTDFEQHCETIEECYEFTLSYAAQGHITDIGSAQGEKLRQHLTRSAEAMRNLHASCAAAIHSAGLEPAARYEPFLAVLARDAESSWAIVDMVLAQPSIGSQLIDNLNASIHLRALLTTMFLVSEILESHQACEAASQAARRAASLSAEQHEVF